jgi:urea transport system ATP-binding protein
MDNQVLTSSLLYLDNVQVSFDGYKALRGLSLVLEPGEMRAPSSAPMAPARRP